MQPRTPRPRWTILQRRRHALIGTASGLGLLLLPITASVVVVAVTSPGTPTVVSTQAAPPAPTGNPLVVASAPTAAPAMTPTTVPRVNVAAARDTHRGRDDQ